MTTKNKRITLLESRLEHVEKYLAYVGKTQVEFIKLIGELAERVAELEEVKVGDGC